MPVTSTYLLDDLPVEIDRLISVAEVLAPEVRATCERAGLGHGGRAVDVGCGPLGALGVLGDIVGPSGEVVGVDASPASLATAEGGSGPTPTSRMFGSWQPTSTPSIWT